MTNEQMDPCRDDGLCSSCADAPRCAACGEYLPDHEDDCDREFVALRVRVSTEAMSLFAPLAPCPECQRPLPVPFNDDYQHWVGCSIAEREVA